MFSEQLKRGFRFGHRLDHVPVSGKFLFSMDQSSWTRLETLRNSLQVASAVEVLRQALTLLWLAATASRNRGQVILRGEDGAETLVQVGNIICSARADYVESPRPQGVAALLGMVPSDRGYEALAAYLRDADIGMTALSPIRFCEVLNVDLQTLADLAHVHLDTLTSATAPESGQRFLRQALQVLRAAYDLSGDIQKAAFWYRNEPLSPFNYKTAERLVSEDRRMMC